MLGYNHKRKRVSISSVMWYRSRERFADGHQVERSLINEYFGYRCRHIEYAWGAAYT